jgi:hypothetical protein
MSILSALKQQNSSIDSLAALPQAMIMQMAQRKEISEAMVAPILSRKAELADAFARQNMLANAGKAQPTVMEQLMSKNAQAEQPQMPEQAPQQMPQQAAPQINPQTMPQGPEDVGIATQATQPMGLAGGGIIAFGNGGMPDEEDDQEESNFLAMMDAIPAGIKSIPHKVSEFTSHLPQSYELAKAAETASHAKDPFLAKIEHLESRGNEYDKHGNILTSAKGAKGSMQVLDKTNLDPGYGVKPAQNNSPEERARVGRDYALALKKHFGDEKTAAMAYNWGPGNVQKWLASHGTMPVPHEARQYASNFAKGGEIRHFVNDGYVNKMKNKDYNDYDKSSYDDDRLYGDTYADPELFGLPKLGIGSRMLQPTPPIRDRSTTPGNNPLQEQLGIPRLGSDFEKQTQKPAISNAPNKASQADVRRSDERIANKTNLNTPIPPVLTAPPTETVTPAQKSGLESFMEQLNAHQGKIDKQRQEDKNMALLTAGLGMLGGTSQYAFENIGKGALAGVQHLSEANKLNAAQQNALDRNMLYAHHYQGVENQAKTNAAANQALRQREYELDVEKHATKQNEIAVNQYNTHLKNQMDALIAKNPALAVDEVAKQKALYDISMDPVSLQLRKKAFPDLPIQSSGRVTFTPTQESLLSKYLPK